MLSSELWVEPIRVCLCLYVLAQIVLRYIHPNVSHATEIPLCRLP